MSRWSLLLVTVLVSGTALTASQKPEFIVRLRVAQGSTSIASGIGAEPYEAGQPASVYLVSPTRTGRTSDGLSVSGFSVYGWKESDAIRVVVLAALPPEGKENRFYEFSQATDLMGTLRFRELARYAMSVGESRQVNEMKLLGIEPMTIEIERTP